MKMSEREVTEAVEQSERIALVSGIAKGLLVTPLTLLALAVALKVVAWLLSKKAPFAQLMSAASLAFLPVALFHLVLAIAASRHQGLTPKILEHLVPSSLAGMMDAGPKLLGFYQGVDVINIWSALMLGLGFSAATGWKPVKGALLGLFLYALFVCVFFVAIPSMSKGHGP
jgi:Yip1 domain